MLNFYDLKNEVSIERAKFKILDLPLNNPYLMVGGGRIPQLCQNVPIARLTTLSRIKSYGFGGGGVGGFIVMGHPVCTVLYY